MNAIYKYELEITDKQTISLPDDAEVLSIQEQQGAIYAWVRVDTDMPQCDRTFIVCGTGNPIHQGQMKHLATIQKDYMVWHFFEL